MCDRISTSGNKAVNRICFELKNVAALLAFVYAGGVAGAQVSEGDFKAMQMEAEKKGIVRVLISLDNSVTLKSISENRESIRAAMERKAAALRFQLGSNALDAGYWSNGIGQISLALKPAGLLALKNSSAAVAFYPDFDYKHRAHASEADDALEEIESAISLNGYADVEVFFNTDDTDYYVERNGRVVFTRSIDREKIKSIVRDVSAKKGARNIRSLENGAELSQIAAHGARLRIDREGFIELAENEGVRTLRLLSSVAKDKPPKWNKGAQSSLDLGEDAEVSIVLKGHSMFTENIGKLSAPAKAGQLAANEAVINQIMADIGGATPSNKVSELGIVHVKLSNAQLRRLKQNSDPRIQSVTKNFAAATAAMSNANVLTNMASAWGAGYRSAGQTIAIIDSGVRRDHTLFNANGTSKVVFEGCFGTDDSIKGVVSICPSKGSDGDSPWTNISGSGAPNSNSAVCNALGSQCSHGTHVAGIASGRYDPDPIRQGVAPLANLMSLQVFSYSSAVPQPPATATASAYVNDIHAALSRMIQHVGTGEPKPYVVNMSIQSKDAYSSECTFGNGLNDETTRLVSALYSLGVPVIASTGNYYQRAAITWPACTPKTIKVTSVRNDSQGQVISDFANVADPYWFTGLIFAAPGGDEALGQSVVSAGVGSSTQAIALRGTSQAAPQIAGAFAAHKAASNGDPTWTVYGASAWLRDSGSIQITISPISTTFPRLRSPNY